MKNETEKELQNFAYNVVWLRKNNGLSKKKMAEILGIGVESLNKIESGSLPPRASVEIFFNIYKCFGIPPADQLTKRFGE